MTLQLSAYYLLRGGHLVQYLGPGYGSWGADQVIRQLGLEDGRFLRRRLVQLLVRGLLEEAGWCAEIMLHLGVRFPTLPPSLRGRFGTEFKFE